MPSLRIEFFDNCTLYDRFQQMAAEKGVSAELLAIQAIEDYFRAIELQKAEFQHMENHACDLEDED